MILSATWGGSFYVCLTEPPDFSHGEHQSSLMSSTVLKIEESDELLRVHTLNTIYEFKVIE